MSEPSPAPPSAIRVLLVDDQKMIGEVVRRVLADQPDIEFHFCSEAEQAPARAQELRPHVILQDLVLPGLRGDELVRLYRAQPATATTPIVILSASDDSSVLLEAMKAGANNYLVKLPNKAALLACIRRYGTQKAAL